MTMDGRVLAWSRSFIGVDVYQIVQVGILVGGAYGESKSPGGGDRVVKGWSRRGH
jgi:hypothetical protein